MTRLDNAGRPIYPGMNGYQSCAPLEPIREEETPHIAETSLSLAEAYVREKLHRRLDGIEPKYIEHGYMLMTEHMECCDCVPLYVEHWDQGKPGQWRLASVVRLWEISGSNVRATWEFVEYVK